MIGASIAAVAVATLLLVLGLLLSVPVLFYVSILLTVVAALALLAGVRRLPAARLPEDDFDVGPARPGMPMRPEQAVGRASAPSLPVIPPSRPAGEAAGPGKTDIADEAQ